jgi:hypothetical protein
MTATRDAEHREYERLPLHLPLQFTREGRSELVECITESISGAEVCFVSPELLQLGERMNVFVLLPTAIPGNGFKIHLKCLVHVERVDSAWSLSGFRIGCRIRDYTILFGNTDPSKDSES